MIRKERHYAINDNLKYFNNASLPPQEERRLSSSEGLNIN